MNSRLGGIKNKSWCRPPGVLRMTFLGPTSGHFRKGSTPTPAGALKKVEGTVHFVKVGGCFLARGAPVIQNPLRQI